MTNQDFNKYNSVNLNKDYTDKNYDNYDISDNGYGNYTNIDTNYNNNTKGLRRYKTRKIIKYIIRLIIVTILLILALLGIRSSKKNNIKYSDDSTNIVCDGIKHTIKDKDVNAIIDTVIESSMCAGLSYEDEYIKLKCLGRHPGKNEYDYNRMYFILGNKTNVNLDIDVKEVYMNNHTEYIMFRCSDDEYLDCIEANTEYLVYFDDNILRAKVAGIDIKPESYEINLEFRDYGTRFSVGNPIKLEHKVDKNFILNSDVLYDYTKIYDKDGLNIYVKIVNDIYTSDQYKSIHLYGYNDSDKEYRIINTMVTINGIEVDTYANIEIAPNRQSFDSGTIYAENHELDVLGDESIDLEFTVQVVNKYDNQYNTIDIVDVQDIKATK